jgi:predicted nucleic acid-binding Zn ribbon protein
MGEGGRGAPAGGRRSLRPKRDEPSPLAALLEAVRARPGWAARLEGARIHMCWVEIAGDQLARHAEPVRLAGGVLVVRAISPAWAEQVRYLAGDLARQTNAVLGPESVRQVTVITGPLQNPR